MRPIATPPPPRRSQSHPQGARASSSYRFVNTSRPDRAGAGKLAGLPAESAMFAYRLREFLATKHLEGDEQRQATGDGEAFH